MFIIISPSILETLYNNIFQKFLLISFEKEWDTVEKMFNYYTQVKDSNQTPYIRVAWFFPLRFQVKRSYRNRATLDIYTYH